MNDDLESKNPRPSRRRILQTVSGVTTLGVLGAGISTTAASDLSEQRWSFETGGEVSSSPTVVDETVFVGSRDNNVYALDAGDGSEQWRFETDSSVRVSSPMVVDETVFIGSYDDNVYALDAGDGSEQWRFETGRGVRSSPTVADGIVFVGSVDSNVYALDANDGSEQWRFETGSPVRSAPTVVDGTVFVGSVDNNVYALDAGDGSEQWRFKTGNSVRVSPTVVDGTVFVGSLDNNVYALDAGDGSEQWLFETGYWISSSPTVVDGTVFVGSDDTKMYALDADDGSKQWSFETGGNVSSSPTVVDETVFVGSRDNNVYALDASDGSEQWRFETGDWISSSPTVVDGTVFVGSWDANVYALDASVEGSSEGSRVNLCTLGHHEKAAEGVELGNDTGQQRSEDEEGPPEELTVDSVEMIGTVLDPIPVTVEVTPATAVEQVVVEVAAPDGVDGLGRREVELDEGADGRYEGELVPYSSVGTLDATVTMTVSDNTELAVGETVVVRPKAFATDKYLGYHFGQGYIEDSDLELLVEMIGEEGIDQAFEAGTKAAVQALAQKAGLGSVQAATAAAVAGKLLGLSLTIGSFVPEAGVATGTKSFAYPEAESKPESLSIAESLTVTAGTDVLPLLEVSQGDLISETLSYSIENRDTNAAVTWEVPFGEAHRPERGHKAVILPFEELTYPGENGIAGEYELKSSYGGGNSSARITVEGEEERNDTRDEEPSEVTETEVPGFGISGALTGLGGAGYLLHRRSGDTKQGEE